MLSGNRSPFSPFNVMIMYEDFGTGKRAKKGLDYVAEADLLIISLRGDGQLPAFRTRLIGLNCSVAAYI
jgi:hypothetical protein